MPATARRTKVPGPAQRPRGQRPAAAGPRRRISRRTGIAAGCVLTAAVVAGAIVFWPSGPHHAPPAPASLADTYHRACLLTDTGDPDLATVQAGLSQAATAERDIDTQTYPLPPQIGDATPYLNSLINAKCTLIFALGDKAATAVDAYGTAHSGTGPKLVVVGASGAAVSGGAASVTVLGSGGVTASAVAQVVKGTFG